MVTKDKVANVGMALEACGNICGSETSNGTPCCIQAGTALHVMNYLDDLLVPRTPLPMGLCCQTPLMSGAKLPRNCWQQPPMSPLACCLVAPPTLGSPLTQLLNKHEKHHLNVVALSSKPINP